LSAKAPANLIKADDVFSVDFSQIKQKRGAQEAHPRFAFSGIILY
jgi:hypothetical protein